MIGTGAAVWSFSRADPPGLDFIGYEVSFHMTRFFTVIKPNACQPVVFRVLCLCKVHSLQFGYPGVGF